MFDTWEVGSDSAFFLVLGIIIFVFLGLATGIDIEKRKMQESAVVAGVAYWAADSDGKVVFKYITQ
jgi:hypothetical protein